MRKEKPYQLQSRGVTIVDATGIWQARMGNKGIKTARK